MFSLSLRVIIEDIVDCHKFLSVTVFKLKTSYSRRCHQRGDDVGLFIVIRILDGASDVSIFQYIIRLDAGEFLYASDRRLPDRRDACTDNIRPWSPVSRMSFQLKGRDSTFMIMVEGREYHNG